MALHVIVRDEDIASEEDRGSQMFQAGQLLCIPVMAGHEQNCNGKSCSELWIVRLILEADRCNLLDEQACQHTVDTMTETSRLC